MIGDISICNINIVKFVVSVTTLIQIQNCKHKIIDTYFHTKFHNY